MTHESLENDNSPLQSEISILNMRTAARNNDLVGSSRRPITNQQVPTTCTIYVHMYLYYILAVKFQVFR